MKRSEDGIKIEGREGERERGREGERETVLNINDRGISNQLIAVVGSFNIFDNGML
jgi:hypothetical protein